MSDHQEETGHERLAGRYELLGQLGDGGMGMVCKARDTETGAVVALKMLRPELAGDPAIAERFKNELLLARKITHKNVCRIYEFSRADDVAYISMEYVEGETLRALLARRGRLPVGEVLSIGRQICAGLAEAHDQGVVHRDLKPENVMVDVNGNVKVMDFGIARSVDNRTTMSVGWVGTPGYMSPEQASGNTATARSDVYSVGLSLYELLTGQPTFVADTQVGVAMKHINERPQPPRSIEPGVPASVERIILKCLEKEPERRFASARELERALAEPSMSAAAPASRRFSRSRAMLIGAAILVAAIGWALFARPRRPADLHIAYREQTLENGLHVILSEDHSAPTVAVSMSYRVGSRDEEPGHSGMAHLFEHLMFMGSTNVGRGEHSALIGLAGGTDNGSTNEDRTIYWERLPANQLELVLFLEADRLRGLDLTAVNLDNARRVVQEERNIRFDNAPFGRTDEAIRSLAYDAFPYRHQAIGASGDLNAVTLEDARAFHRAHYVPSNAVLTIVGDFHTDSALAAVRKHFASIRAPAAPARPAISQAPHTAERRQVVQDPFAPATRVDFAYVMPAAYTPDWYALSIAASVLGRGESSRLNRSLVRDGEIASAVAAFAGDGGGSPLFSVVAQVRQGKGAEQVEKALTESVERLQREPVTPDELSKAKRQARRTLADGLESTISRATQLGDASAVFDSTAIVNEIGPADERVTADDIQRAARRYLTAANRVVVVTVPAPRALAAVPPEQPPPGPALAVHSESRVANPPIARDLISVHLPRPTEFTLPNGLTALVVETHRLPRVLVGLSVNGAGPLYEPPESSGLALLAAQMLRDGTASRTARQIAEQIEQTGAVVSTGAVAGSSTTAISAAGLSDNLEEWMTLVADIVRNPRFPADELNARRRRMLAALEQQRATPRFLADEQFSGMLYGAHPASRIAPAPDALERITPATLVAWHREHFAPQQTIITIVGDVNAGQVKRLLDRLFGDWPKTSLAPAPLPDPAPTASGRLALVDRSGSVQSTLLVGSLGITRGSPDYPAMLVLNHILGEEPVLSRIGAKLREQDGYAYDARSAFTATSYRGPWRAFADVRTAVTEPALRDLVAEIRRVSDEPVPAEELERAKRALVASFAITLEQSSQVLVNWSTWKRYGFSGDYWDTYPAKIAAVTAEEVQQAARRYLDPAKLQIVVVGDGNRILPALQRFGSVERIESRK